MDKYGLCACQLFTKFIRLAAFHRSNKCALKHADRQIYSFIDLITSYRAIETPAVKISPNQANWPIRIFTFALLFAYVMMNTYRIAVIWQYHFIEWLFMQMVNASTNNSSQDSMVPSEKQMLACMICVDLFIMHTQCQSQLFRFSARFSARFLLNHSLDLLQNTLEELKRARIKGERESKI